MPSSLELLYNQIKNTGVAGKDYGEFQNKMADAAYRQNLYKSLTKHGANVGANIGEFEQKLGYGYVAPSNQPAPQPAEQTAPTAQPQKPDGPLTPQDKAEMSNWVNQAQFDTEKQMKQFKEATDATMNISPFGNNKADLIFNKHLRKGNQSFNAETGQFEDTFMTSDGRKFKSQAEASRVQDSLDQFGDYVKYKQNMENLGLADITGEQDKDINKRIEEAYNELENIDVEIDKGRLGQASRMARASGLAGSSALSNDDRLSAQNQDNLLTARRLIERRIKALEAERDDAGFWTGTGNVLTDDSALSFGLSDANDMMALSKIKDKVNSGAPLTNSEKLLARSYLMNQEAQALNNNRDWWYKAGEGFGETLNFMKDFALTGGGFANVAKQGMRMGTKAGLKYGGSDMAKFLTKNLGVSGKVLNKTIQYGAKFGGLAAGAEVGGVALANTVQLPKTMANIAERSMGEMTIDKDGKLAFKDAEDLGKAILYEELKASGENASELVGPAFDLIPGLMGRAIRNKFGGELLKKITSNKFWRGGEKTLDYLGVQSVFGEGMEEEYGMLRTAILNKITGGEMDPNAQDITDLGTQLDTWATVGLTSVLLRAPQIVASGRGQVEHWGYKYNLNQSDQRLKDVFYSPTSIYDAQQYHSVKDMLDNADNKNIGHVINSIVSGGQLTPEQKEAVMYYAQDLINLRGYNIGSVLAASQIDKIMPRTASYQIKGDGKSFDELDQYGNVIAHHEYENADEMKAGLYEAQQNRFDYDLNSDIGVMKIRPDGQYDKFKNDFSFDNEISPEDFDAILEKPSAKRTDAEQQLVQQFAKELHSAVYDNTMLHEEQSAQDGEKAADDASIDMDNPQPTELQEAKAAFMAASGNRRMAFDNNEDLKQEVLRMEEEGLSHQEILSNLESFSTQEQQAVIDYYNQQARYESMVNKVNQKINEEAVVRRNNHTFKGTIDGEADQANVRTITDGTNRYFLVSGNITTDGEGNITGSDSGLIIGMDLDGSFVNIGDTNGYSVEPPTMSLDQYEEAERNNLQVTWTTAIDPDAAEQQEAEVQSNAEGEAGATNGTGANEPSATSVAPQTEQTQIPVDEKTGVKLYEQGVPVDDAINDMEADNLDVLAESDLAINEAQAELDKIKEPKTRAERVKNDAKRQQLQATIDYYNNVKARYNELHPVVVDPAPYIEQINAAQTHKKVDEAYYAATSAGVNPADIDEAFNNRHAEITAREEEERRKAEEITDRDLLLIEQYKGTPEGRAWLLDRKRVPSYAKRIKIAKLIYGDKFDDDFDAWRDIKELISSWLGKGRALDPDSFGQELGWDMGIGKDAAKVSTMFTKRRENGGDGMLFNDFVHMVMEASGGRYTTEDIRNTLIGMFQGAQDKADLTEYQLVSRVDEAEKELRAEEQRHADLAEDGELVEGQTVDVGQMPFAPSNDNRIDPFAPRWTLSDKKAKNGEPFYQNADGSIDLVDIPQEVFDKINYTKAPFRLTKSMVEHVFNQHAKELHLLSLEDAIDFVVDVMTNFDHVRLGDNGSLVFSIENGRKAVGKRAITILLSSDNGDYYGIKTSGFEELARLKKRPLLWEGGAKNEPSTDTATEPVTSRDAQQGGEQSGSASGQSGLSEGEDTEISDTMQENREENAPANENLTNDEIDERHKREYDEYIKPLLNRSDEELQQMAKKIEDSVGGDLKKLEGNKEYSAINLVLLQRKLDREHEDVKVFIQNTIDDGDVSFVDKATVKEFDELNHLINEYGVDDSEGKIEAYVKRLRKKYPVAKSNKPLSEYTLDDFINDARSVLGDNLDWKGIAEWIGHMQTVSKVFALRELKAIFGESWDRIRYIEAANGNYDFGDALSNYIVKKNTEGFNDEPAEQKKSGPLTVEEIDNAEVPKQQKTLAKAYLNGNHGELQTAAYNDIYEEVRGEEVQQETQPQQPTMSKVNVEGLFNDLYTKGETKLSDHAEPVNPMEMIEKKADEFRQEEERKNETPEQKRARLKQEILDKAHKLSEMQKKNVRDDLGKLGMNRLTPSFIPRDKEQRKMFWDLVSTTAEYGYTYIQEGVTNFKEWSKRIYDDVVSTMQDIFGWTQEEVDGYINAVWNSEVEAEGGEAKTLAEFAAEKQNKPNVSDNTVNDNKNVLQGQENNVNLQQKQNNNDNGQHDGDNAPVRAEGQRDGDNGEEQISGVRQGAQQESKRPDGSRREGGTEGVGESDRRSSGRLQGLNKNNNHEERGTESAPTSTIGRIEANIEAIELMQKLVEEGRPATDEEKKVLRQFSGWGGLGAAFANPVYQNKIRELLGDEGYEQANMSRNSAYYTPAKIIDRLWDIARALGFKGGNVLEGSAGIGKIIGLMPTDLSESSHIQAVEIDETTGNILKLLYPDAQVDIQGFEQTKIPNGSIDLAITNVPFVTGLHVKDESGDGDLSKKFGNIHDFCIAKNIRKLKEGGIGIFITSKGTLDDSQNLREWISAEGNADVVGAFRLNNETFGGTPVTSDIIIVRKRVNGNKSANAIDVALPAAVRTAKYDTGKTKKVKNPETGRKEEVRVYRDMPLDYNGYFIEHPEHMGGEMAYRFEKELDYQPTSKACFPVEGKNQDALLDAWVKAMQAKDWSQEQTVETEETPVNNYEQYGEGVKEGSLILDSKGNVCIARYGQAVPLDTNDKKVKGQTKQQCLKDYTAIKNALQAVLDYQMNNEGNDGLQPLLDKLNKSYDQFVRKYGHFHGNTAIAFLRNDVDYASVGALETYREKLNADGTKTPVYGKADVFSKRVVEKEKEPQPTTIKDGVIASIYKFGGIDIPYIAKQLGLSEEEAKKQIIDNELGYENPDTMQVDVSYVYLSGNVREKLQKARENNVNGKYAKNISALEKKIPADIPAHLIEFNLGSTWIENKLYTDFFMEKTGKKVTCRNLNGGWVIDIPDGWTPKEGEGAVISEMCDKTIYTSQLIAAAMQGKTIKVQKVETRRDAWGNKTSETITDKEATQACAARIEELKAEFKDWARGKMQADPELSERTEKTYNDRFNNYAPLLIPNDYAPSHFGGMTKSISMREHQSKAVIKGITQPVMYAHGVGAGKTYTLIATAMEMRRIGTAKKPMIVVQNATVGQFTESAKQLYPGAKILTMDDDHSEAARKAFYAKIKYNDWDLIIISQSVLDKIPDNPDRQIAFIRQKIDEKEMVLEQLRANKESGLILKQMENEIDDMEDEISGLVEQSRERQEKKRKRDEKKRAVAKQNAAVRAKEQLDRSVDDVDDFDDMDIDAILVDEAHGYKKLGFESVMTRVKGVDTGSSKKCASLFLKTRAVLEKSNGKNVVFATGTPVSNTAAEVWTFMRYLMPPDVMKEYGIYYFDDFARNFGNVQQMLEFSTSGKFKENNRFAGYVNMPELARIWASVADTVVVEDAKEVQEKLPQLEGGKATDLYLPQTKALRAIMKKVRYILEQYENMSGKEKKRNSHIPLVAYGIAKAAAVDARLVDAEAEDDPNSKTNEAVRQTLRSLEETKKYNGTVAIFADNYQNKHSGFNLYQDIKKKLIEQGVPENQIAIISGSPKLSDKKKLEIFDKVNKGEIRVVLGSTFTLGTGVNIQERLHTLIHIDAPNRPMDYEQRNGRIRRQGNLHKVWGIPVRILRFGVEDSLDVTAYQRLKTKGAIAESVMKGDRLMKNAMDSRILEEEEDTFGDTVAQLSGSEYAMKKNQAEREVRKLEAKKKQHEADQIFIHAQLPRLKGQNREAEERIEQYKEALAKVTEASKNGTTIEIGEGKYDSLDAMTEFFTNYNSKIREIENNMRKEGKIATQRRELTVKINGFDIKFTTVIDAGSKLEKGRMVPFTTRNVSYSCDELWGNASFTCKGGYIKNGIEEILNETMTGNDYTEAIETAQNTIERNNQQIKALEERQGRDFTEEEALQKAKDRLEEYTQKMKEEMEAKEAKYKEMDAEVEAAGDLDWDNDDDEEEGNEESPKRMITSHDPMEAINQAAESWREENMPNEIKNFVNGIAERFGLNGAAPTYVINSRDELDAMKGEVSESVFKEIEELYNEPDTGAAYIPRGGIVVVFGEKISDIKEAESTWWHEQAHGYWQTLPKNLRESFGNACLDYLFRHHRTDYNHIINDYPKEDHLNEACSFFVGQLISKHGTEKILGSKFEGIEEICNFANGLINYIKNGREQQERTERDSLRHGRPVGSVGESSEVYGRDTQGRERGDNGLRNEKEEVTDPIQAIEESAKRWRKRRKESVEEAEAVKEYSAKQVYNQRVDTAEFVTTEAYQDAMVGLKTIQNAISKDKEIPDSQNAYQAENLMHGTNYVEQEQFNTEIRATLLAAVNDIIKKTGMSYDDVDRYTITKHGLERNRELFVRDWFAEQRRKPANYNDLTTEEQEAYDKMAARIEEMFEDGEIDSEEKKEIKLNQALKKVHKDYLDKLEKSYVDLKNENFAKVQSGEMTFPQYLEAIDNFIRDHIDERYKAEKHDYSGLTALFGKGYKEADVINTLTETENNIGKDLTDALWERINAASQYGLDRYRQAGMRTDELLDRIENMFHWYVPLRGFKEDTGEDMYQYFTSKGEDVQHFGGLIRSAGGRRSEAFSPLVSLVNMSYKTIIDCNQNSVNQKFYRLCQANPNDVVVLSDSWVELDKNTGEWVQAYPQIDEEATEDEVIKAMADFEAEMKGKEREGTAKRLRGKPSFDYRPADKKKRAEHTVEVYINGQRKLMTVVGNPRAAQALNGLTRFRKADNWVSDFNAVAKNWMSKVSTSYNPTFAARNMMRDWTHFEAILLTREGEGYRRAASGYYHPTHMMSLFNKYRKGTLDESIEEERDFKDFMDNGALTGYTHMQKMEDLQNDMKKQLDKMQKKGKLKIKTDTLFSNALDAVEAWNEAIENAARFATYRASRHYAGRTRQRSAYDAKEVTVNFNRKGAGSRTAGFKSKNKSVMRRAKLAGRSAQLLSEGRMFFNATLQAVATIFKNFKNPDGSWNWKYIRRFSTRYALPPFAAAYMLPAINMALIMLAGGGDGDDPYANLPEWVRRKNLCLYLGWIPGLENKVFGTQYSKFMYNNFLTIPIGQELAAFFSLGDLAASMTYAPNIRPVDFDLFNEFVSFINVFSPVDLDTKVTERDGWDRLPVELVARVSTVLAPIVAVEENVSWTGRTIYREDKFEGDKDIPEYQMVYNNTNGGFVWISKGLNRIGGGTDVERGDILGVSTELNPGALQYLVEQYTGGPGKLATNTGSAIHDAWDWIVNSGEDANFNIRKIEIAKAFLQQADDNTQFYRIKTKYRLYKDDADKLYRTINSYAKDAAENPDHYMRIEELTKGEDFARMRIIKSTEADMKRLNDAIYSSKGEQRKQLQSMYNSAMKGIVEELDSVGKE